MGGDEGVMDTLFDIDLIVINVITVILCWKAICNWVIFTIYLLVVMKLARLILKRNSLYKTTVNKMFYIIFVLINIIDIND